MSLFSKLHPKRVAQNVVGYVKAADSVSRPMAILLSVISILVVAALLFTLFLGGRWAFDKIRGDDEPASIETEQTTSSNDNDSDDSEAASSQPAATPTTSAPASSSTPAPTTSTTTTTPPQAIPRTGPSEEE